MSFDVMTRYFLIICFVVLFVIQLSYLARTVIGYSSVGHGENRFLSY